MLFKIKTKIRRFFSKFFEFHRPPSYPFLTGDGFRSIANFVYDQFLDFNPKNVSPSDIVFARNNQLEDYFENIHSKIKHPYILISGNADTPPSPELLKYVDDKIIHWYAQNLNFNHPKISLLPIGLSNFTSGDFKIFTEQFNDFKVHNYEKINRIIFGFTIDGHIQERIHAMKVLKSSEIADYYKLPQNEYYGKLGKYKFIASPRGGGLDCHRTWEAFHFKVIPIMLKRDFSVKIRELELPILLIEKWNDILEMSPEYLSEYYEKNKHLFLSEKLNIYYWYNEFINKKNG